MPLKLAAAALLASSATAFSPSTPPLASRTAVVRSSVKEKPPPSSEFGHQTALYDRPRIMSPAYAVDAAVASQLLAYQPIKRAKRSHEATKRPRSVAVPHGSVEQALSYKSGFGGQTALFDSPRIVAPMNEAVPQPAPKYPTLNGWTPDEEAFCWGLPGTTLPMYKFDPAGLSKDLDLAEMKRYREAEVTHGRVAMLAAVGFLVSESFHPLFGSQISGPAIHYQTEVFQICPDYFRLLAGGIAAAELYRSLVGWVPPHEVMKYSGGELKADYYPGDLGFDPLGLKPTDAAGFKDMQNKELNHGRLAMLAFTAMTAQECVNDLPNMTDLFGW